MDYVLTDEDDCYDYFGYSTNNLVRKGRYSFYDLKDSVFVYHRYEPLNGIHIKYNKCPDCDKFIQSNVKHCYDHATDEDFDEIDKVKRSKHRGMHCGIYSDNVNNPYYYCRINNRWEYTKNNLNTKIYRGDNYYEIEKLQHKYVRELERVSMITMLKTHNSKWRGIRRLLWDNSWRDGIEFTIQVYFYFMEKLSSCKQRFIINYVFKYVCNMSDYIYTTDFDFVEFPDINDIFEDYTEFYCNWKTYLNREHFYIENIHQKPAMLVDSIHTNFGDYPEYVKNLKIYLHNVDNKCTI